MDDLTDPAPGRTFAHLNATTVLSKGLAAKGIYPAVDPLESTSTMLQPRIIVDPFGELDGIPEQAFYLVGNIDEATTKATNLEMERKLKK
ncbi:hypothetical protein Goklo_029155 [Gossypium klotzschianum]|uniref:H(+)-transporting two-sector ATPase n=1 Tax=Gossypium klotzschianum TaxID=34286 RepID=A0A7J8WE63_9ROSI|nr:hypothetical protein [Gossypium klotzschianum]